MRILIELGECGVTTPDGRVCWLAKGAFGEGHACEVVVWCVMTDEDNAEAGKAVDAALPKITHLHDDDGQGTVTLKRAFKIDNIADGCQPRKQAELDDSWGHTK